MNALVYQGRGQKACKNVQIQALPCPVMLLFKIGTKC